MEHISYYDLSLFPLNSKFVLEKIQLAVNNDVEVIFINFGSFFPWSIDNIDKSEFTYTDKLIDKIVSICQEHDIELIPTLSILTNSDFLLRNNKYKYLINNNFKHKGLDVSACGISKLVEEMIDDIFSLLRFSNYLLIELPETYSENSLSKKKKSIKISLKRIYDNLIEFDKKLILGFKQDYLDINKQLLSDDIKFLVKNHYKTTNIFKSNSYKLDIFISRILINGKEYKLSQLNGTDGFDSGIDPENVTENLKYVEKFYHLLEENWLLIKICWEELSIIYRNTDPVYRITFCRSVNMLKNNYEKLQIMSIKNLETFEDLYQPGIIRNWINSKMDSVLNQLKNLENIAEFMSEGK